VSTAALDATTDRTDRADRLAARLSGPVVVAALASIPATFLTLSDGHYATVGTTLNAISGAVLVAETLVLLTLAEDKRDWIRRNRWLVALTLAIIPAVLFAVGPVQLLRLLRALRALGALRLIRVRRILKAGRILRDRHGFTSGWERAVTVAVTLATAAFVAIVLADPTSQSRQFLDGAAGRFGVIGVLLAGTVVAVATFVVRSNRSR
jgi:CsoR family transcriptional regulator, copper-sensing transcriptional repressor